jgi:CheY-like chemotaxis protein
MEEAGHRLTVKLPAKPIIVFADRTRLAQVLANLLNNSAKYTNPGGDIELIVEAQGSDVLVRVRDNGMGIAPDKLTNIFDMFSQVEGAIERSQGGLGVGLNLVRRLVEMHGGRVEAYSDGPGKGSEFSVRLSVVLTAGPEHKQILGDSVSGRSRFRILIVDDNQDSAKSLAMLLAINGHETRTARDGLEAVEAAKSFRPDVAILDIGLPKLNGYDVCRSIRAQPWGADMTIIALSGWGRDEDKSRSREAGFDLHLVKPVDPAELERLLDGLVLTPA